VASPASPEAGRTAGPSAAPSAAPNAGSAVPRKYPPKSARRRSRELALQGLYQWLLSGAPVAHIVDVIAQMDGFGKADRAHFDALLHGGIEQASALDVVIARHIDRPTSQLSPVEHAGLMIGVYELMHCLEVPYRVIINEAVELGKSFGGTDGHKYINGVLDKAATELRPTEAPARR
jgi:transcription antitermination protein NusB